VRLAVVEPAKGTTLEEARSAALHNQPDYITIPRSELRMDASSGHIRAGGFDGPATELALSKLLRPTGLPIRYMAQAPNDLAAHNFNFWFPRQRGSVKLAVANGMIIGAMKDNYTPIPHLRIVERAEEYIGRYPLREEPVLKEFILRNEDLRLRITSPTATARVAPKVGDIVECGVDLINHESIKGYLDVQALFYRLVCANGAVTHDVGFSKRARQIGWQDHDAILDRAFEYVEEAYGIVAAKAAVLPELVDMPLPDFVLAEGEDADDSRKPWLRDVLRLGRVPRKMGSDLVEALHSEDATVYGLYNGLSRLGRDSADPALRLRWEVAAGALLSPVTAARFAATSN